MITRKNKFLMLATAAVVALPLAASYAATNTNFDVTASFASSLSITKTKDMSFGSWFYGHTPASGDTISLGTDDSVSATSDFVANGGTPAAAQATVAGNATLAYDVTCSPTATLAGSTGATHTIQATGIEVTNGAGGAYGSGDPCSTTVPVTYNLTAGADTLKFGAVLDGNTSANFVPDTYSTSNSGGTNVTVDVVYH